MQVIRRAVACGVALGLAACGGDPCNAGKSVFTGQLPAACTSTATPTPASGLVLRVNGTASSADISYISPAATARADDVGLPWTITIPAASGDFIALTASAQGSDSRELTVAILYNGAVLQQSTGRGTLPFASITATCCGN